MSDSSLPPRAVAALVLALVALKALALVLDPSPRLFLGDSMSYLHAAATDWVPPDRSYAYPLFVRLVARPLDGLAGLLAAQAFIGACTAAVLARILVSAFDLRFAAAAALALAFALGPEQLFYERMVMAECVSLFAVACMLAAGFAHVRDGRVAWLALVAIAGAFAVGFRVGFAPLVLGFAVLPVVARTLDAPPRTRRDGTRMLAHAALALACCGLAQHALKTWYDTHQDRDGEYRADYVAHSGFFRLGLVLPLVTEADFTRLDVDPHVLEHLPPGWNAREQREATLWSDDGLVARLRAAHAEAVANRIARKVATRALRRDPLGFLNLARLTLGDYFDPAVAQKRLEDDLGARGPDAEAIAHLEATWGFDASGLATRSGLAREWFGVSAPWLTFCLFALPLLALVTLASGWRRRRGASFLLALASIGLFLGHALFSSIVSFRYLHAFPLFVVLNAGAIAANLVARRSAAAPPVDPPFR